MHRVVAALLSFWRFLTGESDRADGIISRVFEDNFDGLMVIGEDGQVIAASKVASSMLLGPTGGTLAGRIAADVLPQSIRDTVQQAFAEGRRAVPTPMAVARIGNPEQGGYVVQFVVTLSELPMQAGPLPRRVVNLTFWDETDRRRREEELAYMGTHDPATGALTRREFVKEIELAMQRHGSPAAGLSVVAIGLGSLEAIDATVGFTGGDSVLLQAFGRLRAAGFETIARIDGQTFAASRPGRLSEERAGRFCQDLIDRLTLPYSVDGQDVAICVSVGVAHTDVSGYEAESLLIQAGVALAAARERQPASDYVYFDAQMMLRLRERQNLGPALRSARRHGEMAVVYQPQCSLETGALVGVEALVRWIHPELGMIAPQQFVPVAEESGEIVELGRWVLRTACREAASWPIQTGLALNISAAQFALSDVVADVREALDAASLPARRLEIEVTEGPFLAKSERMVETLKQLRSIGVGITLDNFGIGYSSLGQVAHLPIDKIKIAGRFVSRLPADGESGAVIRAVMTLSDTLEKTVVADGIENADQAWMLRMMGCRIGQGPYYGRPRTGTELVEWLDTRPGPGAAFG